MRYTYIPKGICVSEMTFDINENSVISDIHFEGGCDGNLKVLSKLMDGKTVSEIVRVGRYNTCDSKPTSCMDQFAIAVEEAAKAYNFDY